MGQSEKEGLSNKSPEALLNTSGISQEKPLCLHSSWRHPGARLGPVIHPLIKAFYPGEVFGVPTMGGAHPGDRDLERNSSAPTLLV